ncbi:hypothetical protein M472_13835 [Sphingobacterium paucimobilis HER1398]|uniref:KAP NTPase domain-containing protein n=2 Tax=Sphingobacterium TaxID=28453 RepID=U2HWD8_9SPHI|nr:hypothetical protein M472_13835 [Sphingobacterium paucimobilis HER1398]
MTPGQTEPFVINQDSLEQQFKDHLADIYNHRILFSGPFGQGKTTFLNKVFEDEEAEYHTIKLYPVNYSVSSNEDVFQLIKFDILTQLIGKYGNQLNLQKEDFSKLLTAQVFVRDSMSLTPWIEAILSCFGNIGKSSSSFFKAFRDTVKDFDEFHKSIQPDETKDIEAFVNGLIEQEGSAYEMDTISEKIKELIARLRDKSNHKVILAIDDLDRLDPEHIFRLFNVFSTQFEYRGDSLHRNGYNKFDFDKIIFVCDIENIRRIYRHKYGAGVDFKGNLDKFYSHAPFDFDNRQFIKDHIRLIMGRIRRELTSDSSSWFVSQVEAETNFKYVFEWLLISLINNRLLNLRTLLQVDEVHLKDILLNVNNRRLSNFNYPIVLLLQFLLRYYPNLEIFKDNLNVLGELYDQSRNHNMSGEHSDNSRIHRYIITESIPFVANTKKMVTDLLEDKEYKVEYAESLKCFIHFEMKDNWEMDKIEYLFQKATKQIDSESEEIELNPYDVLSKTLLKLKKLGVLE